MRDSPDKPSRAGYQIAIVNWESAAPLLRGLRYSVFVVEQQVPEELEWDGLDAECIHILATAHSGKEVGTARMLPDGRIGRMAVLPEWRGLGVGSAMLQKLVELARDRNYPSVFLHAQTHAIGFYARHGFAADGEAFLEAGIPHVPMRLSLVAQAGPPYSDNLRSG
jgi:predicted GNAT family N-acyltransferase